VPATVSSKKATAAESNRFDEEDAMRGTVGVDYRARIEFTLSTAVTKDCYSETDFVQEIIGRLFTLREADRREKNQDISMHRWCSSASH
jgi:hypothetical protein